MGTVASQTTTLVIPNASSFMTCEAGMLKIVVNAGDVPGGHMCNDQWKYRLPGQGNQLNFSNATTGVNGAFGDTLRLNLNVLSLNLDGTYIKREFAIGDGTGTDPCDTFLVQLSDSILLNIESVPDDITNISSDNGTDACEGVIITLTASGGQTNAGEQIVWYKTDFSNQVGTGNTFSTVGLGTFMARRERMGSLCFSDHETIVITRKSLPEPLTGIIADPTVLCLSSGATETVDLEATFTELGEGGKVVWYADNTGNEKLANGATFSPTISTTDTFYSRIEAECDTTAFLSINVEVIPTPNAEFANSPDETPVGCLAIFMPDTTNPSANYSWDFGPVATPMTATGPGPHEVIFSEMGEQMVKMLVEENGCRDSAFEQIEVGDPFILTVNGLNPPMNLEILEGSTIELNFATIPDDPSSLFSYELTLIHGALNVNFPITGNESSFMDAWTLDRADSARINAEIEAITESCTARVNFEILVKPLLAVSDIITPNGDGFNDSWKMDFNNASGMDPDQFLIKVFDRNGKCVRGCTSAFTVNDVLNNPLIELRDGPYYYLIENATVAFSRKGHFTVLSQ